MRKAIAAWVPAVVAAVSCAQAVFEEIHSISEFEQWHNRVLTSSAVSASISLMGDLSFSETTSQMFPIGHTFGTEFTFSGVIEGNGHTISGVIVNTSGGAGLFVKACERHSEEPCD